MKKIIAIIILAFLTAAGAEAKGQVEKLFSGPYRNKPDVTQIVIKGDQLAPYRLDEFMSLTVTDPRDCEAVALAVEADARKAKAKEVTYSGGKIAYGFITLPPDPDDNHYIFFYRGEGKAVVMYLNGTATPAEVKKMIKKTNKKTDKSEKK